MWIKVFAEWLGALLAPYEPIFKVVSYFVGPAFAAVAFVWNRKDRRELTEKAQVLGVLKEEVRAARAALEESQEEVQKAHAEVARRGREVERLESDLKSITEDEQWSHIVKFCQQNPDAFVFDAAREMIATRLKVETAPPPPLTR